MTDLAAELGNRADPKEAIRAALVAGHPNELQQRLGELNRLIREHPPEKGEVYHDPGSISWIGNQVTKNKVGFLFPGQGSQLLNMARTLVNRFDWAAEPVSQADICRNSYLGSPLSPIIFKTIQRAGNAQQQAKWFRSLSDSENAQPAICLASLIWYRFFSNIGIQPAAVGGHSLGELTAFHAAGAFDSSALLRLTTVRGRAMASEKEPSGTMISLQCDAKQAKAILKRASGYVVLANINSHCQTVLSGEKKAVEKAADIAAREGIRVNRLSVSNGFHSRLMLPAARILESEKDLAAALPQSKNELFSSTSGQAVRAGLSLQKHFTRQIVSKVDFLAMVESMSKTCDLFLEVGPGRVLTDLTNDINGPGGPVCFPVESSPEKDIDLNLALACLFTHGVEIQWQALYSGRLVRPFRKPSEQSFIANPLEKPFDLVKVPESENGSSMDRTMTSFIARLANLSQDEIQAYVEAREPFLKELIKADLNHFQPGKNLQSTTGFKPEQIESGNSKPEPQVEAQQADNPGDGEQTAENIEALLLNELERITGFPPDSMDLKMRLLDDLHLDSIKAGDLISAPILLQQKRPRIA